jgi:hypothetical protein
MYQTQKANGLHKLQKADLRTGNFCILKNADLQRIIQFYSSYGFIDSFYTSIHFPKFFRPCPLRPRHGFVNSRVCNNREELIELIQETLAHDEEAEMIVMPLIDADLSAVITKSGMTVGSGSDGATSGSNQTLQWSLHSDLNWLSEHVGITNDLFLETLLSDRILYYVQARDGVLPDALRSDAWIPADLTVTCLIDVATYDDAGPAYESAIQNAPPGSVLIHRGGTMLSHWAQHAIVKKIPIIFDDRDIKIGDQLVANVALTDYVDHRDALMQGIQYGMTCNLFDNTYDVMQIVLLTLHNAMTLRHTAHGSTMIGFAASALLRYSYAAILGEIRHLKKRHKQERHEIFSDTLRSFDDFLDCRKKITDSRNKFFTRKWSCGYGGQSWGNCSQAAKQLEHALLQVVREKSYNQQAINDLILKSHTVINCAHNNGPFLDKFTSSNFFDSAAHGLFTWMVETGYKLHTFYLSQFFGISHPINLAPWIHCKVHLAVNPVRGKRFKWGTLILQFNRRDSVFHFQYGQLHHYKSCTIDPANFTDQDREFLNQELTLSLVNSLANTERLYRKLTKTTFEMLSADLQKYLILNLANLA